VHIIGSDRTAINRSRIYDDTILRSISNLEGIAYLSDTQANKKYTGFSANREHTFWVDGAN